MARAIIAIGSSGNDGTGDTLRAGAIKINNNFAEVYNDLASFGLLVNDSSGGLNLEGISFDQRSVVFIGADSPNSTPADNNETFLRAVEPTKDNIITLPDSTGTVALLTDIPQTSASSVFDSTAHNGLINAVEVSIIPSATNVRDLGSNTLRFRNAFVKTSLEVDSARLTATSKGLNFQLPVYDSIGVTPSGFGQGHIIMLKEGDSAASTNSGPTLAFKDSDNGNYVKFNTTGLTSGGGGGGF